MMKISFIIPVYNCKAYLPACVDSIRTVGAEDYEILLIDDGSTDGSGDVCDALAAQFPEIRAVHQENGGVSAARNRGIQEAVGEYLLFVDSDDLLIPFDQKIMDCLRREKPDSLIFGMAFQHRRNGNLIHQEILSWGQDQILTREELGTCFAELFDCNYLASACNKVFRRALIENCNLQFDSRLTNYEDLAFSLRVLSECHSIAVFSSVHYLYQIQKGIDHTIQRIARIDDVMGNTDLVADAFYCLEEKLMNLSAKTQINQTVFRVYMELFWVKMQTTPLGQIRRYCDDFCGNANIKKCLPHIHETAQEDRPLYRWIRNKQVVIIWLDVQYRKIRHWIAEIVKRILKLRSCK